MPRLAVHANTIKRTEANPYTGEESERDIPFMKGYAVFNVEGVLSALDGICPHQGGPLAAGLVEGTCVTCPWHGWQFDVRTGQTPLNGRLRQPVFEVKVEGNDVLVWVE